MIVIASQTIDHSTITPPLSAGSQKNTQGHDKAYKRMPPHHRKIQSSNFIIGTFTPPEDGQAMTETCRRYSKF